MRFLVDQAVSWRVAEKLRECTHDAVHVREIGLAESDDAIILDRAATEDRIIITQDTDFGTLLVRGGLQHPSIILLRTRDAHPGTHMRLILQALPLVAVALETGAIVVLSEQSVRVRRLG